MARKHRLAQFLLILLALIAVVHAACKIDLNDIDPRLTTVSAPTSFCKCTCFSNSTLIQLTGHKSGESGTKDKTENGRMIKAGTCDDCNRQFCMKQELAICKGAEEEDVFTTCFQRDSAKDEAVVFLFIFATVGLLAYAAVRPWIGQWIEVRLSFYTKKYYTNWNDESQGADLRTHQCPKRAINNELNDRSWRDRCGHGRPRYPDLYIYVTGPLRCYHSVRRYA